MIHPPKISKLIYTKITYNNHILTFCELLVDANVEVGEGRAELTHEALHILRATLEGQAVGLVGYVAVEDLVGKLQAAFIPDLLDVTPEGGLILFLGGHAVLLLPRARFL
jgi:hypothetical protein